MSIELEEFITIGYGQCHRCQYIFEEGHEKEGRQCPNAATGWSVEAGHPACRHHPGGSPPDIPPDYPEVPGLRKEIYRLERLLDEFDKMEVREMIEKGLLDVFNKLNRTKANLIKEWRQARKQHETEREFIEEERDWYGKRVSQILKSHIRDPKVLETIAEEMSKALREVGR